MRPTNDPMLSTQLSAARDGDVWFNGCTVAFDDGGLMDLVRTAAQMYEASNWNGIQRLAEANWPDDVGAEFPEGIADAAYFARALARRQGDSVA